jgi:hypothetical protein
MSDEPSQALITLLNDSLFCQYISFSVQNEINCQVRFETCTVAIAESKTRAPDIVGLNYARENVREKQKQSEESQKLQEHKEHLRMSLRDLLGGECRCGAVVIWARRSAWLTTQRNSDADSARDPALWCSCLQHFDILRRGPTCITRSNLT